MGDAQQDAAAKRFSVPADKAAVYVYRNESIGAAVKMDVEIDGKPIGQTAANTFLYKEVVPGKHTIASKAENTDTDVRVRHIARGPASPFWPGQSGVEFQPRF